MRKILGLMAIGMVMMGCFNADWDNNNYPEFSASGEPGEGCSSEEWMAFYDANSALINMSRETWLEGYPGK